MNTRQQCQKDSDNVHYWKGALKAGCEGDFDIQVDLVARDTCAMAKGEAKRSEMNKAQNCNEYGWKSPACQKAAKVDDIT